MAGLLELGHEFGVTIDLDTFDRERKGLQDFVEEVGSAAGWGG